MAQVVRDLQDGKSVQLSYRHKVIGVLQPINAPGQPLRRGSPEAIRQGLKNLRSIVVPDLIQHDPRSLKEQVSELRSRKYR